MSATENRSGMSRVLRVHNMTRSELIMELHSSEIQLKELRAAARCMHEDMRTHKLEGSEMETHHCLACGYKWGAS